jgi:Tol biopolymer transport system component
LSIRKVSLVLLWLAVSPAAHPAELVSVNATGTAAGNAASSDFSLSADGRFVAFVSFATDLVPGGTSGGNVFVRDLLLGTTVLASTGDDPRYTLAGTPRISADGHYVAYARSTCVDFFCSLPSNVYVRDLQAGTTTLVSVGLDGQPAGGYAPVISADGRHVAFQSAGGNLVPHDSNGLTDVFVRDLDAGVTYLASANAAGGDSGNGASGNPSLSADGRFVAFESDASDLVAGDGNGARDVFYRDLQAGITRLVSANAAGTGSGNGGSGSPSLAADGSRVAFASSASDLVPVDTNGDYDVFVRDLPSGPTRLVSINTAGTDSGNSDSGRPYLTPNGRFVAFESSSKDLVDNNSNLGLYQDVFLRDLDAGVTQLVSVHFPVGVVSHGESVIYLPVFLPAVFQAASDDGRFVVFASSAEDLVSGVSNVCDYSPCYQVYRRDLRAGVTELLSATPTGDATGNRDSFDETGGRISGDGRVTVFETSASNLTGLPDTNGTNDLFAAGAPLVPPVTVPTLSETGLFLLAFLMAGLGLRALRR